MAIYCSDLFLYPSNTLIYLLQPIVANNESCLNYMLPVNMQVGHGWKCIDPLPIWPIQKLTRPFDLLTHCLVQEALMITNVYSANFGWMRVGSRCIARRPFWFMSFGDDTYTNHTCLSAWQGVMEAAEYSSCCVSPTQWTRNSCLVKNEVTRAFKIAP